MSDIKLGLFTAFERQLRHLSQRQAVVAQNIANADTPGYRARDVAPPAFAQALRNSSTGSGDIARPEIEMPAAFSQLGSSTSSARPNRTGDETKPNGNTVLLESELAKQAEVQLDYATITNLYRKQMGLIRLALGKSRGN